MASALDGAVARSWFEHALRSLLLVRTQVDELNVFPVPDSDTGTNLALTMAGAAQAARDLPADADLATMTRIAAEGALLGARGNSGIMLAQAMTALAVAVDGAPSLDAAGLARALEAAAAGAREAVAVPVPGTMLTAAEAAALAATRTAQAPGVPVAVVAAEAAAAGRAALVTTRGAHGAPTVDAGAAGYVVVLAALVDVLAETPGAIAGGLRAELRAAAATGAGPAALASADGSVGACSADGAGSTADAFEVMYVLRAGADAAHRLRARLTEVGDSVAVVGRAGTPGAPDERGLWHVHVHTPAPAAALAPEGEMAQVCVRYLQPLLGAPTGRPTLGVVACTGAPGLLEPLARTGAVAVLGGDAPGIARAAADLGAAGVRILPCGDDARRAAESVAARPVPAPHHGGQDLSVADTGNDLAVLAAAAELATCPPEDADAALRGALAGLRTRAVPAPPGGVLAADAATRALADLLAAGGDLVTAVLGAGAADDVAPALTAAARAAGAELVLLHGGQPAPALLLGAE